jgi:hypothetical protein
LWISAGTWRNVETGEAESFAGARNWFMTNVEADWWPHLYRAASNAVTCVRTGDMDRKRLGLLFTFMTRDR